MGRELVKDYSLLPDTEFLGFLDYHDPHGLVGEYALSTGLTACTIETWYKFPTEASSFSSTTLRASAECLGSYMAMALLALASGTTKI